MVLALDEGIDLEGTRVPTPKGFLVCQRKMRPREPIKGERFLPPLRESWLAQVGGLDSTAFKVAVVICFWAAIERHHRAFKLTPGKLRQFGIGRMAASRAIQRLEEAGLIQVTREVRRSPRVMVLAVSKTNGGGL
jgi:hypothetical protein